MTGSYAGFVGAYDVADTSQVKTIQEMTFELTAPGPGRHQEQARPHQVTIESSGRFLLAPDLGADLVRIFEISPENQLKEIEGLSVPKGSFPRHVALVTVEEGTKLYVLLQEINLLLAYDLKYGKTGGLEFTKVDEVVLARTADGAPIIHSEERYLKASHIIPSVSDHRKFAASI